MNVRKKATLLTTTAIAFGMLGTSAFAHHLWVLGKNDDVFKADMVYGHSFPTLEKIAEERMVLFEPVKVFGKNYEDVLSQTGESYHYEAKKPLMNGTYIVQAYYKPTPWSEKADGEWEMAKTRKDIDGKVKSCGIYSMFAKTIVSVGGDDGTYAMQPLGTHLEITPMVKADEIAVDQLVKFKITRDGEPVKQAVITGNYQGYSEHPEMSAPFYAKSNLKGEFEFRPLRAGLWFLHSNVETETGDADCETRGEQTTLTFYVK